MRMVGALATTPQMWGTESIRSVSKFHKTKVGIERRCIGGYRLLKVVGTYVSRAVSSAYFTLLHRELHVCKKWKETDTDDHLFIN
jgi:hypothetical protein